MLALVRDGAEMYPVDLGDLDRDIRMGQVSPTAELLHPPWTGARFAYLTEIPQLRDAFDAPDARMNLWMRRKTRPTVSVIVAALAFVAAALQAGGSAPGSRLSGVSDAMARLGGLGFEPTLLEGAWWTPLASQLVHDPRQPFFHLLVNLPLVAYGGYRVERALGPSGYAVVAAASVLTGAAFVLGFTDRVVVGSSLLGFGLWAAQIAIGFRWSHGIPVEQRGFYGWGTWLVFAPLYLLSLVGSDVSHVGHMGGVIGGFLAVAALSPVSTARAPDAPRRARVNTLLALALLALSPALCLILPRSPSLLAWPALEEVVEEQSVALTLPLRLANHPLVAFEGAAWVPGAESDEPIFVSRLDGAPVDRQAFWSLHLAGVAGPIAPAVSAPEGWTATAWLITDPDTHAATWRVEEWLRTEDERSWAAGFAVRVNGHDPGPRMRYYREAMADLRTTSPAPRRP